LGFLAWPWAGVQGQRVFDFSGYANHGSFAGDHDPVWDGERHGPAVYTERDGSNTEYVDFTDGTPWSSPPPFTIASWGKPGFAYGAGGNYTLFHCENARVYSQGADYYRFYLYFSGADLTLTTGGYADREAVHDQWTLFVMRAFSDGTADAWQNLYRVGTDTWSGSRNQSRGMHLGQEYIPGAFNNWEGWIGPHMAWNRAITDAEIRQLYYDPACLVRVNRRRDVPLLQIGDAPEGHGPWQLAAGDVFVPRARAARAGLPGPIVGHVLP
jgi:hypothetical protein